MGYVIPLLICSIVAFIAIVLIPVGLWQAGKSRYGGDGGFMTAFMSAAVLLITLGIGAYVLFPLSGQYHRFVPKTGTVATIGSRLVSSGSGSSMSVNQKYVVTFTDGESYGVLDTRAANVKPGDKLTVMCERVFQFNAPNEGWDCNWGQDVKPNGVVIP
jgi:hypothetical protein